MLQTETVFPLVTNFMMNDYPSLLTLSFKKQKGKKASNNKALDLNFTRA